MDKYSTQEWRSVTTGKCIVVALQQEEERQAISSVLDDLGMTIYHAQSGRDIAMILEDHPCDCLLMDVKLSDMYAWQVLAKLKEFMSVTHLPIVVIMDEQTVMPMGNITPVVRPVAIKRLKAVIGGLFVSNF